jgi:hypothetical protein
MIPVLRADAGVILLRCLAADFGTQAQFKHTLAAQWAATAASLQVDAVDSRIAPLPLFPLLSGSTWLLLPPCHPPAPLVQVQYSAPKLKVSALPNSTSSPPPPALLPPLLSAALLPSFQLFVLEIWSQPLPLSASNCLGLIRRGSNSTGGVGGLELCETTPSVHWYPFSVGLSAQASIIAETNLLCLKRRFNSISTCTISWCEDDITLIGSEPRDVRQEEDSGGIAKEHI